MKTTPAPRMDGLWKQENTAGKVQVLEGKARRHLAGKEWFVPMSWNDHSYVTEGQTGTQNTVGSSRWAQRQYGTGRARGSESGACFQQLCDLDQGHLPFLDPPCARRLGALPYPGCQNVLDGWCTLDWQLKGCEGWRSRKRKPNLSHFTLLKGGQKQNPNRKQPKTLCLQRPETVL